MLYISHFHFEINTIYEILTILSPWNYSLNIIQDHEIVGVHGVVRVGHDEYPGVELKVNMENILILAGQKDEIFANFGT